MIKLLNNKVFYYLLLLAAHIGLVWMLPYFPTQDGPSHLYNLVILQDLLNGGREWGNFFTCQLHAVPNLGFNMIAYPLLQFFTPLVVERLFLTFYIILMAVSVPILLRTFERPSLPLSYLLFPVIFNFTLLMGFYSYIIAVPLFLLAFSFAWRIRNHSSACRFVCLNMMGVVVFYLHLIPFLFFLLSVVIISIVGLNGNKNKICSLCRQFIIVSPSILLLLLYMTQRSKAPLPDFSYLLSMENYLYLLMDLMFFSTANAYPLQLVPASIFALVTILLIHASMSDMRQRKSRGENVPPSQKCLLSLATILILIYFFAPFQLGDGSYFNERFPWVILLILLPMIKIPPFMFSRFGTIVIAGVAGISILCNAVVLWQQSAEVGMFLKGLDVGLPKGAFIMTYKHKGSNRSRSDVLLHAASYYGIATGSVDIGNYETGLYYFPTHFRSTLPSFPSPGQVAFYPTTIDWHEYPWIQYVFGWELHNNDRDKLNKSFHVLVERDRLTIWERNRIGT